MTKNDIIFYQSGNKKALFRFLRSRKAIGAPANIDSVILSPNVLADLLAEIASGIEKRFTSQLQLKFVKHSCVNDFVEVNTAELKHVVRFLPNSAPGPDGITSEVLKILFDLSPEDLLNIVNHSLRNGWITPYWRLAKIVPLLKKQEAGVQIDNIRPMALTSHAVKLIEIILYIRIMKFITENKY